MTRAETSSNLPSCALREFTKWSSTDWEGGVPLSELLERINRVAESLPGDHDGPDSGPTRSQPQTVQNCLHQGSSRRLGWWKERIIDPFPQIYVAEQVPTQQRDEIGEQPVKSAAELKQLNLEHGAVVGPLGSLLASGLSYDFGEAVAIHERKKAG